MPDLISQILAISSGLDRLTLKMLVVNLMGCHLISSVYLCGQHRVLKQELNSICLGSLYVQDVKGPTSLYEMEIVPQVKMVFQLQAKWYLVYSPWSFTSHVICSSCDDITETSICFTLGIIKSTNIILQCFQLSL